MDFGTCIVNTESIGGQILSWGKKGKIIGDVN